MKVSADEFKLIQQILKETIPEKTVWAFGSRVHGHHIKPFSDLDLVIMTAVPLDTALYQKVIDTFCESNLPFKVDIVDWARIKPSFQAIIEQHYEVVQLGDKSQ